ncbi:amino acid ABC transporter permease [Acidisphaera sp. L21]|uniref:amino acid ABC transporter permease n=1 Tax=Acidisphaera sp. L21 TaxID=1641851 RepID=UPI00131B49EF|nr:amino acid ABC transporter permease [Acidisphaera sp. L21]
MRFTYVHLLFILHGFAWTIGLSALSFALGGIGGLILMLLRTSRVASVRWVAAVFMQIIQGIPVLILLVLSYYGLGFAGLDVPPLVAAGIGMMLYASVYLADIWRGSMESIPKTQWEAAECLPLSRWQTIRLVVIPQAVRISLPSTVGFLVQILKSTSLASVVGFIELTRSGQLVNNSIIKPFLVFLLVGLLYFALCYPLSIYSQYLERRLHVGRRQTQ